MEAALTERKNRLFLEYLSDDRIPRNHHFPEIAAMLLDDHGLLWVKRYDRPADSIWLRSHALWPAPGGTWQIVRPTDGVIIATVEMPADLRPLDIKGDRVLGVALSEFDVPSIVLHRLDR